MAAHSVRRLSEHAEQTGHVVQEWPQVTYIALRLPRTGL
jgi:hypothetical protein